MISVTVDQMRRVDELTVHKYGIFLVQMMELAGFNLMSLTRRVLEGSLNNKSVVVLAGKGNNGGGGLVAARHMYNCGAKVLVLVSQRQQINPIVKARLQTLRALGIKILFFNKKLNIRQILSESDLLIDALIGYSLEGNPRYPISEIIEQANASPTAIVSLDLPSGLDANTGKSYRPCIKADHTLTLALPKKGLLKNEAREYIGKLYLADIGIPPSLYKEIGIEVGNIFKDEAIVRIH
jgi:NAD(P)H-hydrate epimerase